tara:strand:- start:21875 stop:23767 length:1893 start_codon:yes stop_codon:yes gene_type:complete
MADNKFEDDAVDVGADEEIDKCLNLEAPNSFFLFAGAGSGKTRSLTEALKKVLERSRDNLRHRHKRIAVITYTNAACDEIKSRIQYDPVVSVSTIHSFVWSLLEGLNADIRSWLEQNIGKDIADLEDKERKGRGGEASQKRLRKIESKSARLADLPSIKKFTYNPNGDNVGRDSLNHAEVIAIGAEFLTTKPLMQQVLVTAFPILLVDESQDTHAAFMNALLAVQAAHADGFSLGLIGDTMQRIYGHGMADMDQNIPPQWATPAKIMNHRSPSRIVRLINRIRHPVDGREQRARQDKDGGEVRLFIAQSGDANPDDTEENVRNRMAEITGDENWSSSDDKVKALILEHHMAARRLRFADMFEPLYKDARTQTGLLDGTLPALRLFSERVLPVVDARLKGDEFRVSAIVRRHSGLMSKDNLAAAKGDQTVALRLVSEAIDSLAALCSAEGTSFQEVLSLVAETGIFPIPDTLRSFAVRENIAEVAEIFAGLEMPALDLEEESGWTDFLTAPFSQIVPYRAYVDGSAAFDTHQGVKGRQFDRVMVIIDDAEARGFLFSYDKLFGTKERSATDIKNEEQGKETGLDRTRRLLYVTCSRAMESLALVLYSPNPEAAREHSIDEDWFSKDEVELI